MPRISDEAKSERRRQIIDGARGCFAEFGYEGATLPRLEEATGLTRGGIFHYFESKRALFAATANASSERLERIWREQGYAAVLEAVAEEDPAWIAVQIEASVRARTDVELQRVLEARNTRRASDRLEDLRPAARSDVPIEQIAMFLSALANGLALRRATGDLMPDPNVLDELVRTGVGPRGR